jgi:hypothetical protein
MYSQPDKEIKGLHQEGGYYQGQNELVKGEKSS